MQECCMQFIVLLDCTTTQDRHHLIHFRLKSQRIYKMIPLSFDNVVYQTITILQKSSGFMEGEPVSSNSAMCIV